MIPLVLGISSSWPGFLRVTPAPGATVSTPLHWDEVHVALDPRRFTLVTIPTRLAETGDPFAGLLDERPDVPSAVEKLGALGASSAK